MGSFRIEFERFPNGALGFLVFVESEQREGPDVVAVGPIWGLTDSLFRDRQRVGFPVHLYEAHRQVELEFRVIGVEPERTAQLWFGFVWSTALEPKRG